MQSGFNSIHYDEVFPNSTSIRNNLIFTNLENYADKITNYSFICTLVVVWSFTVLVT